MAPSWDHRKFQILVRSWKVPANSYFRGKPEGDKVFLLKIEMRDFSGGAVVKNPPANAGDGFNPWSGKIPHAAEQLSPCATTTEPVF